MILSRAHGLSPVLCDTNTSHSLPPRDAPLQADSSRGISKALTPTLIDDSQGNTTRHTSRRQSKMSSSLHCKKLLEVAPTTNRASNHVQWNLSIKDTTGTQAQARTGLSFMKDTVPNSEVDLCTALCG